MTASRPPRSPRSRRVRQRLPRLPLPLRHWPRSRRLAAALAAVLLVVLWWGFGGGERTIWPRARILAAIRFVESGDRANVPDGDGGKAIGPYQIHRVYWQDAVTFAPGLGGDYQDCRRADYAERVIDAYMAKWVPDAWANGEAEVIARVHNGGPNGHENPRTQRYWERVRARLP